MPQEDFAHEHGDFNHEKGEIRLQRNFIRGSSIGIDGRLSSATTQSQHDSEKIK
jgi:hypothetical protein